MAEERTWALTGRLLLFTLLLAATFGAGYWLATGRSPAPEPEPTPDEKPDHDWQWLSPAKARSYGLPEIPRDGIGRYPSMWWWAYDGKGAYRYALQPIQYKPHGELEVKHEPLPETRPGKPLGRIGDAP